MPIACFMYLKWSKDNFNLQYILSREPQHSATSGIFEEVYIYHKFLSNSNYKVLPQPQIIKCQHEDKLENITA